MAAKARVAVELPEDLEAFVRDQASKLDQRPGEYLRQVARAVQLAHTGDLTLIGMLLPSDLLERLLVGRRTDTPVAPLPVPLPSPGVNSAAIDAALDEYA